MSGTVVLVTPSCYLVCESINYITITENRDEAKEAWDGGITRRKRKKSAKEKLIEKLKKSNQRYQIVIDFVPVQSSASTNQSPHRSSSSDGTRQVVINLVGYERCLSLFKEIISQIREQIPDRLFLDKLVENFFANNPSEEK